MNKGPVKRFWTQIPVVKIKFLLMSSCCLKSGFKVKAG